MSDSSSICSSHSAGSVSLSKMECPYCTKDIQARGLFSHIRKFHNVDFLKSTNRKWVEDAVKGQPLRMYWERTNDFDEMETTTIYVCLSTHKTFMTPAKCEAHFKKDKVALKDHNKQLTQLKKDMETLRKQEAKLKKQVAKVDPYILRRDNAFKNNDPELARAIWRGILNNIKTLQCALAICYRSGYRPDTTMYKFCNDTKLFEQIAFSDFIPYHNDLVARVDRLQEAKCMDVKLLHKIYIQTLLFWKQNYEESIMGFHTDMKQIHPFYNYVGDEAFYNYATEEMEGVDF